MKCVDHFGEVLGEKAKNDKIDVIADGRVNKAANSFSSVIAQFMEVFQN